MRADIFELVPFSKSMHLAEAIEVLRRVRGNDPGYPPPQDLGVDLTGADRWLLEESGGSRWVATVDGKVAGHVQLVPLHSYLANRLGVLNYEHARAADLLEIIKLFVDPLRAGHGLGTALLNQARAAAWDQRKQPILAVLASSDRAIRLYEQAGLRQLGSFDGIHGLNLVFVDESHPDPTAIP